MIEGANHHAHQPERAEPQSRPGIASIITARAATLPPMRDKPSLPYPLPQRRSGLRHGRRERPQHSRSGEPTSRSVAAPGIPQPSPLPSQCQPRHGHHRCNLTLSPPRTCLPIATPRHGAGLHAPSADLEPLHLLLSQHEAENPSPSSKRSPRQ